MAHISPMFRLSITISVAAIICIQTISCSSPESNRVMASAVNPIDWEHTEIKSFTYHNSDTTALKEIAIFLSYDNDVTGSIPLEITTQTPDTLSFSEPMLFTLCADSSGSRYETTNKIYRSNVRLNREGDYCFSIGHTLKYPVKGIRSVGIEIEERQQPTQ